MHSVLLGEEIHNLRQPKCVIRSIIYSASACLLKTSLFYSRLPVFVLAVINKVSFTDYNI